MPGPGSNAWSWPLFFTPGKLMRVHKMLILYDQEAAVVIERLFELEKRDPEYQDRDKYGRTLAEKLELQFSHSEGKEF